MSLASILVGDLVRVDKRGRIFVAEVQSLEKGALGILPLDRRVTYRTAEANEVKTHWALRGRPRR